MNSWALQVAVVLTTAALQTHAFVAPSHQVQHRVSAPSPLLHLLPEANPFLLTDGLSAATYMGGGDEFSGPLSTLRTFFVVLSAAVFGITAIAYLTAAFLVPKAAEQLEQDTKRLRPGLWEEYEGKLEEGQEMVNRPDLLQELGKIVLCVENRSCDMHATSYHAPQAISCSHLSWRNMKRGR